jgi:hypothetical protein
MLIGFSTGVYYKLFKSPSDRFDVKYIDLYKNAGANAIELMCSDETRLDYLMENSYVDRSIFPYISMHAPDLTDDCTAANRMLSKLEKLRRKIGIANFVFHADRVSDWSIFDGYDLPISVENMDERKNFGRTIDNIASIMEKYPFGLTLDLQHCFVNDPSMKLAEDFQNKFGSRIVEYHLSGYKKSYPHYPLFKTDQLGIITALRFKDIPIIIESGFDKLNDAKVEFDHIISKLQTETTENNNGF